MHWRRRRSISYAYATTRISRDALAWLRRSQAALCRDNGHDKGQKETRAEGTRHADFKCAIDDGDYMIDADAASFPMTEYWRASIPRVAPNELSLREEIAPLILSYEYWTPFCRGHTTILILSHFQPPLHSPASTRISRGLAITIRREFTPRHFFSHQQTSQILMSHLAY